MEKKRLHIAGVGHREVERIIFPLVEMKADRVVFLVQAAGQSGDPRAATHLKEIRRRLRNTGMGIVEQATSLWDAAQVARSVRDLVERNSQAEVRFNASTGPKTCAIGGYLASLFTPMRCYYVHVDYTQEQADPFSQYRPTGVGYLPRFRALMPRADSVEVLGVLLGGPQPWQQADLLRVLQKRKLIDASGAQPRFRPQAAYSQLVNLLGPLVSQGYLERTGQPRAWKYEVTEEGRTVHRMLGS